MTLASGNYQLQETHYLCWILNVVETFPNISVEHPLSLLVVCPGIALSHLPAGNFHHMKIQTCFLLFHVLNYETVVGLPLLCLAWADFWCLKS